MNTNSDNNNWEFVCAIYICVSTHLIHYSYEVGAIIFPLPTEEEVGADILRNLPEQDILIPRRARIQIQAI